MTGILLISLGRKCFADMARNLALSVRLSDPFVKIAVLTDNISEEDPLFDYVIRYQGNAFEAKTKIFDLSPFENTLYLDADTVFFNTSHKIADCLTKLNQFEFAIVDYGEIHPGHVNESKFKWAKLSDVYAQFKIEKETKFPCWQTSAIWFKKTDANKQFFKKVKNSFGKVGKFVSVRGSFPDELAYDLAGCQTGKRPEYNIPMAFGDTQGTDGELIKNYWFLSLAGSIVPDKRVRLYNAISSHTAQAMGEFPYKFDPRSKR